MSATPPPRPADDVSRLPGVNAVRRRALERLGVRTVEDLLRLAPRRHEDRRHPTPIAQLVEGTTTLVVGVVQKARAIRARHGLGIHEAVVSDETGEVRVRWFHRGFVPRPLAAGQRVALFGPVRTNGRRLELTSPALERLPDPDSEPQEGLPGAGRLVPVHPLTTGLSAPVVRRMVWAALPAAEAVEDAVPARVRAEVRLPPIAAALRDLHFPEAFEDAERARRRLAFDELLVHEILLVERRLARTHEAAEPILVDVRVDARIRARLPFRLTPDQDRVVSEISADLARPHPMYRLLQGDVGSGKTAVAAYALLAAVARGLQGAFMAPTEVLVGQHTATLDRLLAGSRVRMATVTGSRRGKARREALERVAAGDVDLVLGTHAVISRDVTFARLGLVVVDEQHKFGVRQRHELVAKAGDDAPLGRICS